MPNRWYDYERLEYCLRSTAKILNDQKVKPNREADVQRNMNHHLSSVFPDYIAKIVIAKPIKSFKPDGGVRSLKAAIEFKFATNKTEISRALSGITEDLTGYAGSED
jgi:hypothetical protein